MEMAPVCLAHPPFQPPPNSTQTLSNETLNNIHYQIFEFVRQIKNRNNDRGRMSGRPINLELPPPSEMARNAKN